MMNRSPLTPFTASAINNLKNFKAVRGNAGPLKPPSDGKRVDSDLKKAANVLTDFTNTENVAPNNYPSMQAVRFHAHPHHPHLSSMVPNPMGWMWPMVPAQARFGWTPQYPTQPPQNDMERFANIQNAINERPPSKKRKQTVFDDCTTDVDNSAAVANQNKRRKRSAWMKEEDEILKSIVEDHLKQPLKICWSTVARHMPDRDSKQCRDRWLNHLDPAIIDTANTPWTVEEDRKMLQFIAKHGTRWRLMQTTILPNRTELTIKNRWNSSMKRRYTRYLAKRWNVLEEHIQVLTWRGLLHPGVDIEQMLGISQCKMSDVAYNFGEPTSSKDVITKPEDRNKDPEVEEGKLLAKFSSNPRSDLYVHVTLGRMTDDSFQKELGVVKISGQDCFVAVRKQLSASLLKNASDWQYCIPSLGAVTTRQESDFGIMAPYLRAFCNGEGTEASPLMLQVVE